jgi:hypothetical protein
MAKNSSNILALGVGLNLDPLNQDIANAAKTAKEGMAVVGQSVVDGGAKASGATEKLGDKVQSMRQQLRLATQDAQQMAEKFGVMSTQAIASASRAGELKDKIGDINTVISAFAADSKFTVVAGALQQAAGAASIVTGAMGLLGTESKATQEMLLKVQSALALTQGLAQIKEMGASFTALQAVIVGKVIPSILAINTATMLGIGGLIVAIGAITLAVYKYNEALDEEAKLNERVNDAQIANIANKKKLYNIIDETAILQNDAQGKTLASELFANETSYKEAKKALDKKNKDVEGYGANRGKILYQLQLQENALEDKFKRQAEEIRAAYAKKELDATTLKNKQLTAEQEAQAKAALAAANKNFKDLADLNKKLSTQDLRQAFAGPKDITGQKDANGLNAPKFIEITYKIKSKIDTQELEASIKQSIKNVENAINTAMEQMAVRTISILSQAIGSAVGGMKDPFHNLGWILLQSIGTIMVQLGEAVLAIGIGMLGLDMALKSLNPFVAIAAGALLIAGGAALNAVASNGIGGGTAPAPAPAGGGGGGNNSNMSPNSNYIGGQNSGNLVIEGYVRGNDINFVNGKSGSKNNRNLRFG